MCCYACNKILAVFFAIVALAMAIIVSFWSNHGFQYIIIYVDRFFSVMIPILAVGALFKYLFSCHPCHSHAEPCEKK